jgi:hypothetical protein
MEPAKLVAMDWPTLILTIVGTALISGLAAFFGAYLGEKAKNRALIEDLDKVVRATEEIKSAISGDLWVAQERWKLKRDNYTALVLALTKLRAVTVELMSISDMEADAWKVASHKLTALHEEVALAMKMAELWLSADALKALGEMVQGFAPMPNDPRTGWPHSLKTLDTVNRLLVGAARKDIMALLPGK